MSHLIGLRIFENNRRSRHADSHLDHIDFAWLDGAELREPCDLADRISHGDDGRGEPTALINFWFPAVESQELRDKPVQVRMLDTNFVLFHDADGVARC